MYVKYGADKDECGKNMKVSYNKSYCLVKRALDLDSFFDDIKRNRILVAVFYIGNTSGFYCAPILLLMTEYAAFSSIPVILFFVVVGADK